MGMKREYGYREYPDDLSPAKGGLSNLLYDADGSLATHADFHAEDREEEVEEGDVTDAIVLALAVLGAAAVGYVADRGVRALMALRTRRAGEAGGLPVTETEDGELVCAAGAEDLASEQADALVDADDALIEEVEALCEQSSTTLRSYRPVAPVEESQDAEVRAARSRRERSAGA